MSVLYRLGVDFRAFSLWGSATHLFPFLAEVFMRFVKTLSVVLAVVAMTAASTVLGQSITQYGKAAWAAGTYPGGPNAARYYGNYGRSYAPARVYSAPVVAATPPTEERRAFSAEPATPDVAVSAAPVAPAARAVRAQEYNRFGKGPTTSGLTPPGYGVTGRSR
jgi:hypothetical protein